MPKRMVVLGELSESELEARFRASQCVVSRCHWQMVWLLKQGRKSEEVSRLVGLSLNRMRILVRRYNAQGAEALGDKRHHNPGGKPLLDQSVRDELAVLLEGPVPEELGGGLWNGVKVAAWLSQRLERSVHRQRGHEALRALGYTSQSPRPHHVGADPNAQEAFKKTWRSASKK